MPLTDIQWQGLLANYQAQQSQEVALNQAKERYDLRQRMLNDIGARDHYVQERWETLGQTWKASRPLNDPIREHGHPGVVADIFRQTFTADRAEELDAQFEADYAEYVQEQEVKEFLTRRAAIAQATFEQHKMLNPDASDQDAFNAMHRQLIQYGFQPRGLETRVPFRLKKGQVVQEDYTPVWSEVKSLVMGVVRGARRLAMAPSELTNAGLELATDVYNRNEAGAEVTGSNVFRDSRRAFAFHVGAIEQMSNPKEIPYNFDVAGVIGEQVPNLLATISGAGMWQRGAKLAGNALAMGSMFALEGANAYNRYMQYGEQKGIDPRLITTQAYAGAMAYGAASAALERLIPMETFKRIPGLKNRAAAWALGSLAEGTTEFLQSLAETGIGVGVDLAEFNWDSIRMAMREAAAGVLVGGVAGATIMGRVTPQVDQLSQLDVGELKAKIETELDALKKRAEIRDEVEPPVQIEGMKIEVGEETLGLEVKSVIPPQGPPVQPEAEVQTTSEAIDRVVAETTGGVRSKLLKSWRAVTGVPTRLVQAAVKVPTRLVMKIPAESVIGRIRDSMGRGLSNEYGRPEGWVELIQKARGRERVTEMTAEKMATLHLKALKADGLDPQKFEEVQAMAELATRGELPMENLPAMVQTWAQTARVLQDAESLYGARIYRAAGLDQKADTFEKNIGKYLKSIPLARVNTVSRVKNAVRKALGLKVSAAFDEVKRDGWTVWDGKKLIGKYETEAEARGIYKTAIAQRKSQVINKWAKKRGVTPRDINRQAARSIKIEAPLTPEWRKEFEVHNPAFLLSVSMVKCRHDAEMIHLFHQAAQRWGQEAPQGLSKTETETWAKETGLVQLPQSGRLHNLAGLFVPKAIAKDLTEMTQLPGVAAELYNTYISAWKSSKTLWNPATHGRNIFGDFIFAYLDGCSIWNPLNAKFYRRAAKALWTQDENYTRLIEEGVMGTEYYGTEIKKIMAGFEGVDDSKIGRVFGKLKATQQLLGRIYTSEDQVFKLASYFKHLSKGLSSDAAAAEVNDSFPNYERVGKITRWLRKSPLGAPFISFVDQAIRIGGRKFVRNPVRVLSVGAIPGMLTYLSAIALGMSPDEKRLIDKERGYFEPILPWRNEKGAVQTLDLRYITPLANDVLPEERRGALMIPWMFSGPAVAAVGEPLFNRERFTGREIITENMTGLQRVKAYATAVAKTALPYPSIAYWGVKRTVDSVTGDRDESVANAIVGSILGLNVRTPYIAERHVKQIIQNMIEENDWLEARTLLDVWNKRYKPGHLKNLRFPALVRGLRQTKLYKWRKVRDEAATAMLQGRDDDAQEIIDDYMTELGPGVRRLTIQMIRARAKQLRWEGRTR